MICKHCGKWSGWFVDEHFDCAQAAAQGKALDCFTEVAPPRPLTSGGVFWAVFGALWAFGISAGILVFIVRLLLP